MRSTKSHFFTLFAFMACTVLVLSNGFANRVLASEGQADVYRSIAPIGDVLNEIMESYVEEPDIDEVVEGALVGMMNALDRHSSYVSAEMLQNMREDHQGEFEGIGISIEQDDEQNIRVVQPIAGSPASRKDVRAGDIIVEINGENAHGMSLSEAAQEIRGPEGTTVELKLLRRPENGGTAEVLDLEIERGKIPIESVKEARLVDDGIGYIYISDFKAGTADEIREAIADLKDEGMTALVLDLRWNPGGLLSASKEATEIFLPQDTLVTYTEGRGSNGEASGNDLRLYTEESPELPENFPVVILVNGQTASSSEIVTGALQYWARAIVVGEKTYGKGSVQTLIPLRRPENSALRLTTAHYYTPGDITIDKEGIRPDVEVEMDLEAQLGVQRRLHRDDVDEEVEDAQLQRAIEILQEDDVFDNLIARYHQDPSVTQVAWQEDSEQETEEEAENGESASQ